MTKSSIRGSMLANPVAAGLGVSCAYAETAGINGKK
jgi:hypothetical protein